MRIHKTKTNKKIYIITALIILLVGAGVGAYFFFIHKNTPASFTTKTGSKITSDPNVPGGSQKNDNSDAIINDKDAKKSSTSKPSNDTKPVEPRGVFVSNHRPSLSGDPTPNSVASTCTTTPGVGCKIQFKKEDVIKELPLKTTDAHGNTEWYWTLQELGLSQGTWKITAVAINGTASATSNDIMDLEVRS